ncbi:hypothetical protein O5282_18040 [Escherichia coli]|nr:hypothetical protein [Escherichia coli]
MLENDPHIWIKALFIALVSADHKRSELAFNAKKYACKIVGCRVKRYFYLIGAIECLKNELIGVLILIIGYDAKIY